MVLVRIEVFQELLETALGKLNDEVGKLIFKVNGLEHRFAEHSAAHHKQGEKKLRLHQLPHHTLKLDAHSLKDTVGKEFTWVKESAINVLPNTPKSMKELKRISPDEEQPNVQFQQLAAEMKTALKEVNSKLVDLQSKEKRQEEEREGFREQFEKEGRKRVMQSNKIEEFQLQLQRLKKEVNRLSLARVSSSYDIKSELFIGAPGESSQSFPQGERLQLPGTPGPGLQVPGTQVPGTQSKRDKSINYINTLLHEVSQHKKSVDRRLSQLSNKSSEVAERVTQNEQDITSALLALKKQEEDLQNFTKIYKVLELLETRNRKFEARVAELDRQLELTNGRLRALDFAGLENQCRTNSFEISKLGSSTEAELSRKVGRDQLGSRLDYFDRRFLELEKTLAEKAGLALMIRNFKQFEEQLRELLKYLNSEEAEACAVKYQCLSCSKIALNVKQHASTAQLPAIPRKKYASFALNRRHQGFSKSLLAEGRQ